MKHTYLMTISALSCLAISLSSCSKPEETGILAEAEAVNEAVKESVSDSAAPTHYPERLLAFCDHTDHSDSKCGYMNIQGDVIIPALYNAGLSNMPEFTDEVVFLEKGRKLGAINRRGEVVLPFEYRDLKNLVNYAGQPKVTDVKVISGSYSGSKLGLVTHQGELLCVPEIESDLQRNGIGFYNGYASILKQVEQDGVQIKRYGLINKACETVLSYKYEKIGFYGEGLVPVQKDGLWGYVDLEGNTILDFKYSYATVFSNGVATITTGKRDDPKRSLRIINKKGKTVKKLNAKKYDFIERLENGYHLVWKDRQVGLLNNRFKTIIEPSYQQIYASKDYGDLLRVESEDKYGYINLQGEEIAKPEYDRSYKLEEGMIDVAIYGEKGPNYQKAGYLDKTGKLAIPLVYDNAVYFSDGLSAVAKGEVYNGKAKWGYIDKTGKEVIPLIYDRSISFSTSDHLGAVKKGRKWGFVNKEGEVIVPFIYNEVGRFIDGYARVEFESLDKENTDYKIYKKRTYQMNAKGEPIGFDLSDVKMPKPRKIIPKEECTVFTC